MSDKTKIQWTDVTWNIAIGCTKISNGCKNRYMYLVDINAVRERFVKLIKEVVEIAEWKND